jgi:hypothetical protein
MSPYIRSARNRAFGHTPGCRHLRRLHPIPVIAMTEIAKTKFPILRMMTITVLSLLPALIRERRELVTRTLKRIQRRLHVHHLLNLLGQIPPPAPVRQPEQTRRSTREKRVPVKPGNVYGDKHPATIEKEMRKMRDWKQVVGEQSSRPQ